MCPGTPAGEKRLLDSGVIRNVLQGGEEHPGLVLVLFFLEVTALRPRHHLQVDDEEVASGIRLVHAHQRHRYPPSLAALFYSCPTSNGPPSHGPIGPGAAVK